MRLSIEDQSSYPKEKRRLFRSGILHFLEDPAIAGDAKSHVYYPDGVLCVRDGRIEALGSAKEILSREPETVEMIHYPDGLIVPGFVDCHVHYPQTGMIAAYGEQLIEWLKTYTFPTEKTFADPENARRGADFFLMELLRNGTTTAMVLPTVHRVSVEAFFEAAVERRMRMICGKVLMDRNAPPDLLDTAGMGFIESKALIEKWHGKERLRYAVTPRFAPTSSSGQLSAAGKLLREYPDVYLHTHLSENLKEVQWVASLFPESAGYLDVYDRAGLVGHHSVFAHCIHLTDNEMHRLCQTGASIAFCPSSNLFLGSGLFNLSRAQRMGVRTGIGTDVGGGTSLSILRTLQDAYKTQQLLGNRLSPMSAFYLATLGGARVLDLDDFIGNFLPGKEADFIVLDDRATPLQAFRSERSNTLEERLFSLAILGDDRSVKASYILGELAF